MNDEYEEILKYEVSGVYKEVNARRKGFFWEMREVNDIMNVDEEMGNGNLGFWG